MQVRIQRKNVYGNELIYPVDHARDIERLTGKKTINNSDIEALKNLGVEIIDLNKIVEVMAN